MLTEQFIPGQTVFVLIIIKKNSEYEDSEITGHIIRSYKNCYIISGMTPYVAQIDNNIIFKVAELYKCFNSEEEAKLAFKKILSDKIKKLNKTVTNYETLVNSIELKDKVENIRHQLKPQLAVLSDKYKIQLELLNIWGSNGSISAKLKYKNPNKVIFEIVQCSSLEEICIKIEKYLSDGI